MALGRLLLASLACLGAVAVGLTAFGAAAPPAIDAHAESRVAAFYYPWWGTPRRDGAYLHWAQNNSRPPGRIAAAFFPARGVYSSADARVVAAHMADLRRAHVDTVIVSWWGDGSPEDARLGLVREHALRRGLSVAIHVEPYRGRTPESVAADVTRLRDLGVSDFYVYDVAASAPERWRAANEQLDGVRVFAQTHLPGVAAAGGFDGLYTYDVLMHDGLAYPRMCEAARARGLACAPSVGPGYDSRAATGDTRVRPRRRGQTYDRMWRQAIRAGADVVTITSYNEWHEGTQIEPARAKQGYQSYEGAYSRRGTDARVAYLERTGHWAARYERKLSRGQ